MFGDVDVDVFLGLSVQCWCGEDVGGRGDIGHLPKVGEREFFIDNLLVLIHLVIVMIRWTGLAPWEFEFPFPGSLISTFLGEKHVFF